MNEQKWQKRFDRERLARKHAEQLLEKKSRELYDANQKLLLALEQAKSADKAKSHFLATISHELRTPLTTILSRTQALQMGVYGQLEAPVFETIQGVRSSGNHLLSLINEVLDLSKIESGEMEITPEWVHIQSYCQEIINNLQPIAKTNTLTLTETYKHTTPKIKVDRKRFRQLIVNLLSNAIKFTPANHNIGLLVEDHSESDALKFTVWDEGIGISPEDQKNVFKPFMQIDNTLARKHEGTGLGLSIVSQLVKLHHGSITVESVENTGSQFIVILPITHS